MKRARMIAAAAALVWLTSGPVPASARDLPPDPESLQARVDAVLLAVPGGVQVDDDSIAWEGGEIILVLEGGSNELSIGTCSTGKYCAWSAAGYSGNKLSFTACSVGGTSNSLAPLGTNARSLANARTTGTVKAKNGATVVWSLAANTGVPSNGATLTTMVCFS